MRENVHMKIIYNQNPLKTEVHLDEDDINILKLKIEIDHLRWYTTMVNFHLNSDKDDSVKINSILKEVEYHHVANTENDDLKFDQYVNKKVKSLQEELKLTHIGDCTCFPASCIKCYTEDLLGINTIPSLGKYSAYEIYNAFFYNEAEKHYERTIDEALKQLQTNSTDNKEIAFNWLKQYKEDHGF